MSVDDAGEEVYWYACVVGRWQVGVCVCVCVFMCVCVCVCVCVCLCDLKNLEVSG